MIASSSLPSRYESAIAIQSPKGYSCLICFRETNESHCFRNSTFAKHLKSKHNLRLQDVKNSIVEDHTVRKDTGYVCPSCQYFGKNKGNYVRHCQKTCKSHDIDLTVHSVEVFSTGHLYRVINPSPPSQVPLQPRMESPKNNSHFPINASQEMPTPTPLVTSHSQIEPPPYNYHNRSSFLDVFKRFRTAFGVLFALEAYSLKQQLLQNGFTPGDTVWLLFVVSLLLISFQDI